MQDLPGVQFAAPGTIWHVLLAPAGISWARHRHRHARGRAVPGVRRAGRTGGGQQGIRRQQRLQPRAQALGYEPNRTSSATRRREPALLTRWKLTRDRRETTRRDDTEITGAQDCLPAPGL
jgi:hypothetical protein